MRDRFRVVTFSVSETDFEDGFVLSLQTGINALFNEEFFLKINPNSEK